MHLSNKKFSILVMSAMISIVLFNVIYIGKYTSLRQFNPSKLALTDVIASLVDKQKEGAVRLYDRKEPIAKQVIEMAYGPYAPFILNSDIPISVPNQGEYSLPQVRVGGKDFFIRENPELRYRLWENQAPDYVLLGSSMFFQNINRAIFHERLPGYRMIDFCIGDNIPTITLFLLSKLNDDKLWFKPGSTVIYGINTYELMQGYNGQTWPHIYESLRNVEDQGIKKKLNTWLRQTLKTQGVKFLVQQEIVKFKRRNTTYILPVSEEMSNDPEGLEQWLLSLSPQDERDYAYPFDREKVNQLISIIRMVKESNAEFVLVLLPSSSWDIGRHGPFVKSLNNVLSRISEETGATYLNLWAHKSLGINDTDFIMKGKTQIKLNPQHLNYDGTIKFTNALLDLITAP